MLYVAVSCYSLAFGLLFGLLWSLLSIKSLLRCTACTLGNRSYYNFRSINIRLFTLTRRLFFRNGSFSEPISRCLTSKLRFTKIMNAWIKSFILYLQYCLLHLSCVLYLRVRDAYGALY